MPTVTLELPPEIDEPLRAAAAETGRTPEELILVMLATLLHQLGHPPTKAAIKAGQDFLHFVTLTPEQQVQAEEETRLAAIDAGTGALADTSGTVADFLADRRAEVEEEERR